MGDYTIPDVEAATTVLDLSELAKMRFEASHTQDGNVVEAGVFTSVDSDRSYFESENGGWTYAYLWAGDDYKWTLTDGTVYYHTYGKFGPLITDANNVELAFAFLGRVLRAEAATANFTVQEEPGSPGVVRALNAAGVLDTAIAAGAAVTIEAPADVTFENDEGAIVARSGGGLTPTISANANITLTVPETGRTVTITNLKVGGDPAASDPPHDFLYQLASNQALIRGSDTKRELSLALSADADAHMLLGGVECRYVSLRGDGSNGITVNELAIMAVDDSHQEHRVDLSKVTIHTSSLSQADKSDLHDGLYQGDDSGGADDHALRAGGSGTSLQGTLGLGGWTNATGGEESWTTTSSRTWILVDLGENRRVTRVGLVQQWNTSEAPPAAFALHTADRKTALDRAFGALPAAPAWSWFPRVGATTLTNVRDGDEQDAIGADTSLTVPSLSGTTFARGHLLAGSLTEANKTHPVGVFESSNGSKKVYRWRDAYAAPSSDGDSYPVDLEPSDAAASVRIYKANSSMMELAHVELFTSHGTWAPLADLESSYASTESTLRVEGAADGADAADYRQHVIKLASSVAEVHFSPAGTIKFIGATVPDWIKSGSFKLFERNTGSDAHHGMVFTVNSSEYNPNIGDGRSMTTLNVTGALSDVSLNSGEVLLNGLFHPNSAATFTRGSDMPAQWDTTGTSAGSVYDAFVKASPGVVAERSMYLTRVGDSGRTYTLSSGQRLRIQNLSAGDVLKYVFGGDVQTVTVASVDAVADTVTFEATGALADETVFDSEVGADVIVIPTIPSVILYPEGQVPASSLPAEGKTIQLQYTGANDRFTVTEDPDNFFGGLVAHVDNGTDLDYNDGNDTFAYRVTEKLAGSTSSTTTFKANAGGNAWLDFQFSQASDFVYIFPSSVSDSDILSWTNQANSTIPGYPKLTKADFVFDPDQSEEFWRSAYYGGVLRTFIEYQIHTFHYAGVADPFNYTGSNQQISDAVANASNNPADWDGYKIVKQYHLGISTIQQVQSETVTTPDQLTLVPQGHAEYPATHLTPVFTESSGSSSSSSSGPVADALATVGKVRIWAGATNHPTHVAVYDRGGAVIANIPLGTLSASSWNDVDVRGALLSGEYGSPEQMYLTEPEGLLTGTRRPTSFPSGSFTVGTTSYDLDTSGGNIALGLSVTSAGPLVIQRQAGSATFSLDGQSVYPPEGIAIDSVTKDDNNVDVTFNLTAAAYGSMSFNIPQYQPVLNEDGTIVAPSADLRLVGSGPVYVTVDGTTILATHQYLVTSEDGSVSSSGDLADFAAQRPLQQFVSSFQYTPGDPQNLVSGTFENDPGMALLLPRLQVEIFPTGGGGEVQTTSFASATYDSGTYTFTLSGAMSVAGVYRLSAGGTTTVQFDSPLLAELASAPFLNGAETGIITTSPGDDGKIRFETNVSDSLTHLGNLSYTISKLDDTRAEFENVTGTFPVAWQSTVEPIPAGDHRDDGRNLVLGDVSLLSDYDTEYTVTAAGGSSGRYVATFYNTLTYRSGDTADAFPVGTSVTATPVDQTTLKQVTFPEQTAVWREVTDAGLDGLPVFHSGALTEENTLKDGDTVQAVDRPQDSFEWPFVAGARVDFSGPDGSSLRLVRFSDRYMGANAVGALLDDEGLASSHESVINDIVDTLAAARQFMSRSPPPTARQASRLRAQSLYYMHYWLSLDAASSRSLEEVANLYDIAISRVEATEGHNSINVINHTVEDGGLVAQVGYPGETRLFRVEKDGAPFTPSEEVTITFTRSTQASVEWLVTQQDGTAAATFKAAPELIGTQHIGVWYQHETMPQYYLREKFGGLSTEELEDGTSTFESQEFEIYDSGVGLEPGNAIWEGDGTYFQSSTLNAHRSGFTFTYHESPVAVYANGVRVNPERFEVTVDAVAQPSLAVEHRVAPCQEGGLSGHVNASACGFDLKLGDADLATRLRYNRTDAGGDYGAVRLRLDRTASNTLTGTAYQDGLWYRKSLSVGSFTLSAPVWSGDGLTSNADTRLVQNDDGSSTLWLELRVNRPAQDKYYVRYVDRLKIAVTDGAHTTERTVLILPKDDDPLLHKYRDTPGTSKARRAHAALEHASDLADIRIADVDTTSTQPVPLNLKERQTRSSADTALLYVDVAPGAEANVPIATWSELFGPDSTTPDTYPAADVNASAGATATASWSSGSYDAIVREDPPLELDLAVTSVDTPGGVQISRGLGLLKGFYALHMDQGVVKYKRDNSTYIVRGSTGLWKITDGTFSFARTLSDSAANPWEANVWKAHVDYTRFSGEGWQIFEGVATYVAGGNGGDYAILGETVALADSSPPTLQSAAFHESPDRIVLTFDQTVQVSTNPAVHFLGPVVDRDADEDYLPDPITVTGTMVTIPILRIRDESSPGSFAPGGPVQVFIPENSGIASLASGSQAISRGIQIANIPARKTIPAATQFVVGTKWNSDGLRELCFRAEHADLPEPDSVTDYSTDEEEIQFQYNDFYVEATVPRPTYVHKLTVATPDRSGIVPITFVAGGAFVADGVSQYVKVSDDTPVHTVSTTVTNVAGEQVSVEVGPREGLVGTYFTVTEAANIGRFFDDRDATYAFFKGIVGDVFGDAGARAIGTFDLHDHATIDTKHPGIISRTPNTQEGQALGTVDVVFDEAIADVGEWAYALYRNGAMKADGGVTAVSVVQTNITNDTLRVTFAMEDGVTTNHTSYVEIWQETSTTLKDAAGNVHETGPGARIKIDLEDRSAPIVQASQAGNVLTLAFDEPCTLGVGANARIKKAGGTSLTLQAYDGDAQGAKETHMLTIKTEITSDTIENPDAAVLEGLSVRILSGTYDSTNSLHTSVAAVLYAATDDWDADQFITITNPITVKNHDDDVIFTAPVDAEVRWASSPPGFEGLYIKFTESGPADSASTGISDATAITLSCILPELDYADLPEWTLQADGAITATDGSGNEADLVGTLVAMKDTVKPSLTEFTGSENNFTITLSEPVTLSNVSVTVEGLPQDVSVTPSVTHDFDARTTAQDTHTFDVGAKLAEEGLDLRHPHFKDKSFTFDATATDLQGNETSLNIITGVLEDAGIMTKPARWPVAGSDSLIVDGTATVAEKTYAGLGPRYCICVFDEDITWNSATSKLVLYDSENPPDENTLKDVSQNVVTRLMLSDMYNALQGSDSLAGSDPRTPTVDLEVATLDRDVLVHGVKRRILVRDEAGAGATLPLVLRVPESHSRLPWTAEVNTPGDPQVHTVGTAAAAAAQTLETISLAFPALTPGLAVNYHILVKCAGEQKKSFPIQLETFRNLSAIAPGWNAVSIVHTTTATELLSALPGKDLIVRLHNGDDWRRSDGGDPVLQRGAPVWIWSGESYSMDLVQRGDVHDARDAEVDGYGTHQEPRALQNVAFDPVRAGTTFTPAVDKFTESIANEDGYELEVQNLRIDGAVRDALVVSANDTTRTVGVQWSVRGTKAGRAPVVIHRSAEFQILGNESEPTVQKAAFAAVGFPLDAKVMVSENGDEANGEEQTANVVATWSVAGTVQSNAETYTPQSSDAGKELKLDYVHTDTEGHVVEGTLTWTVLDPQITGVDGNGRVPSNVTPAAQSPFSMELVNGGWNLRFADGSTTADGVPTLQDVTTYQIGEAIVGNGGTPPILAPVSEDATDLLETAEGNLGPLLQEITTVYSGWSAENLRYDPAQEAVATTPSGKTLAKDWFGLLTITYDLRNNTTDVLVSGQTITLQVNPDNDPHSRNEDKNLLLVVPPAGGSLDITGKMGELFTDVEDDPLGLTKVEVPDVAAAAGTVSQRVADGHWLFAAASPAVEGTFTLTLTVSEEGVETNHDVNLQIVIASPPTAIVTGSINSEYEGDQISIAENLLKSDLLTYANNTYGYATRVENVKFDGHDPASTNPYTYTVAKNSFTGASKTVKVTWDLVATKEHALEETIPLEANVVVLAVNDGDPTSTGGQYAQVGQVLNANELVVDEVEGGSVLTATWRELERTIELTASGGKYHVDDVAQPTLTLYHGATYTFNFPAGHPLKLVLTDGAEVAINGPYTVPAADSVGPFPLSYDCASHEGMGGAITVSGEALAIGLSYTPTSLGRKIAVDYVHIDSQNHQHTGTVTKDIIPALVTPPELNGDGTAYDGIIPTVNDGYEVARVGGEENPAYQVTYSDDGATPRTVFAYYPIVSQPDRGLNGVNPDNTVDVGTTPTANAPYTFDLNGSTWELKLNGVLVDTFQVPADFIAVGTVRDQYYVTILNGAYDAANPTHQLLADAIKKATLNAYFPHTGSAVALQVPFRLLGVDGALVHQFNATTDRVSWDANELSFRLSPTDAATAADAADTAAERLEGTPVAVSVDSPNYADFENAVTLSSGETGLADNGFTLSVPVTNSEDYWGNTRYNPNYSYIHLGVVDDQGDPVYNALGDGLFLKLRSPSGSETVWKIDGDPTFAGGPTQGFWKMNMVHPQHSQLALSTTTTYIVVGVLSSYNP